VQELFKSSYYWLDLAVGFGSPVVLFALVRLGAVDRRNWRLFWLGACIGLVWEIPIFVLSKHTSLPIIHWIRELPAHYAVFLVSHTLWDGAIFVVGVWLAVLICGRPVLSRFRWGELAVLLAWGQITAFAVEFSSVTNQAWAFIEGYWWNPTLLHAADSPITLMMQAVWLIASAAFYLIALRMPAKDGVAGAND